MTNKTTTQASTATSAGKVLKGVVVSAKMQKTIVVAVSRYVKHPKYKKYLTRTKRYLVYDEQGTHKEGETVEIRETRPMSKNKSFEVIN
jgi:small subunit ribosomal protein S17